MHQLKNKASLTTLAFALGLTLSCAPELDPNPEHCWYAYGDRTCEREYGEQRPYCVSPGEGCAGTDENLGCVADLPSDGCYSPCGGEQLLTEDDSCLLHGDGDGDGDAGGDGEGEGDGDGGTPECASDTDCPDASAPFCDSTSGLCVPCDQTDEPNASCTALSSQTPICEGGLCVECTPTESTACTDETPICDAATNTCVGCTAHDQCGDGACNLDTGGCMDASMIKHVDADDPACTAQGPGTPASPYCSLSTALASLGYEKFIMLHETANPYQESVEIGGWVAIFAAPYQQPKIRPVGGQPGILVHGYLFARGLEVSAGANGSVGVEVNGSAWIEQSQIVNNTGGGIVVDGGGMLVLENSFVGGSTSNPALSIIDGQATVAYSTLALAPAIGAPALACEVGVGANSLVRNSIIVSSNAEPEVDCADIVIETSALEAQMGDNLSLGDVDINWFVDYLGGDFHLSGSHPMEIDSAATWQPGDPLTDIDGDARPMVADTADFAGADVAP